MGICNLVFVLTNLLLSSDEGDSNEAVQLISPLSDRSGRSHSNSFCDGSPQFPSSVNGSVESRKCHPMIQSQFVVSPVEPPRCRQESPPHRLLVGRFSIVDIDLQFI